MEYLWAPWRDSYVKKAGTKMKCFFCAYSKQKKDRKNLILHRGLHAFAILNRFPYNVGHLMVVPFSHKADIGDLTSAEVLEMHEIAADMIKRLRSAIHPEGFNLGINLGRIAGAGVPGHLHLHLVPRYAGDTNFMPVVGKTKVLPISLEKLHDSIATRPPRPLKKRRNKGR